MNPPESIASPENGAEEAPRASRQLGGHGKRRPIRDTLSELVDSMDATLEPDHYGDGEVVRRLETRVADLLGKEDAVFMPSGTMAQQIALRIWCDRAGNNHVAFHPLCHLELHEQDGYRQLHGLRSTLLGTTERMFTVDDLERIADVPAAVLWELPQREIGGQLPTWDELGAMVDWARQRGVAAHLDGARLWESKPFYGRPYPEIAGLFDSVYVSFYKIIGGVAGAALAGSEDFIKQARVWMRRHGGNLIHMYPMTVSAEAGLDLRIDRVDAYHRKAVEIAEVLASLPGVRVVPDPPHTNMMHVYIDGDKDRLLKAHKLMAEAHDVDIFRDLNQTILPDVQSFELTVGDATLDFTTDEVWALFESLLRHADD